jgi:hypothetical protein
MSGPYKVVCVLGEWQVVCGSFRAAASSPWQADNFAEELSRLGALAARSGSPEGWPEGADAEGAELVPTYELFHHSEDWERWGSRGWTPALKSSWGPAPSDALVVARRKPKPVTRDVRADEVRGEVTVFDGLTAAVVRPGAHHFDARGYVKSVDFHFVASAERLWRSFDADALVRVLVEDPNG